MKFHLVQIWLQSLTCRRNGKWDSS